MKKIIIYIISYFCFTCNAQIVIDGNIILYPTNEPARFTNVMIMKNNTFLIGSDADDKGYFHIEIPQNIDTFSIVFSCFGYKKTIIPIVANNIQKLTGEFIIGKFETKDLYFTENDAKTDIEQGKVQIYIYLHLAQIFTNIDTLNTIADKYGFKYVNLFTTFEELMIESVKRYNSTVEQYLEKINGKLWRKDFENDLKELQYK
jgi:hypothetical protein